MKLANYTRYSESIPRRLLREKFYLLPLYYLLRTSYLAREGMDHSGSYHFADHIYRGSAKGELGLGWLIDRLLLALPSARSFQNRYRNSRDQIVEFVRDAGRPCRILSVPCGLPRDLAEAARMVSPKTQFFGLDIDPEALSEAKALTGDLSNFEFVPGDAFHSGNYPVRLDVITSSGFAEFLDDEQLKCFYRLCHGALNPGGILITSSTLRNRFSDYMLTELAELRTHYRDEADLRRIFQGTCFEEMELERDTVGYQIFVLARKASMLG